MTDNALLSETNKESDTYLNITSRNTHLLNEHRLGLRLGYTDYNKENTNDVFSWGLFDQTPCFSNKLCHIELKGQNYSSQEPMTTDTSFNNTALFLSLESSRDLSYKTSLDLETSYEVKNYHSLNRTDHAVNQAITASYDLNAKLYLEAHGDIGILFSNDSDFTNYNLLLSALAEYILDTTWKAHAELGLKQNIFLSRTLTTQTQVTRRRNQTVSFTDTSKERYTGRYLVLGVQKDLSANSIAGFNLESYQQSSVSGYQDYNELKFLAKVQMNF